MNTSLDHQRTAIATLGDELRSLVDATVRTASPETLHRVAAGVPPTAAPEQDTARA